MLSCYPCTFAKKWTDCHLFLSTTLVTAFLTLLQIRCRYTIVFTKLSEFWFWCSCVNKGPELHRSREDEKEMGENIRFLDPFFRWFSSPFNFLKNFIILINKNFCFSMYLLVNYQNFHFTLHQYLFYFKMGLLYSRD